MFSRFEKGSNRHSLNILHRVRIGKGCLAVTSPATSQPTVSTGWRREHFRFIMNSPLADTALSTARTERVFMFNRPVKLSRSDELRLDEMFRLCRESHDDPEASANFMPQMWAKIEMRRVSTNWFDHIAKALVAAAVAASVIAGLLISSATQSTEFYKATFVEALVKDHAASLEPLSLDRLSELETAGQ